MGDRSNIVIVNHHDEREDRVWLYGHWMGPASIDHAVVGLQSGLVTDESYLARIIFDSMIDKARGDETGYGISTYMVDNEYPIIVIDPEFPSGPRVWIEDEAGTPLTRRVTPAEFVECTDDLEEDFDELIARIGMVP